jgi:hypothetical protein
MRRSSGAASRVHRANTTRRSSSALCSPAHSQDRCLGRAREKRGARPLVGTELVQELGNGLKMRVLIK